MRGTHGWAEVSRERKREIIEAIAANRPTRGPVHAELDLTDRCNVACYFCNQQDLRTKESIALPRLTELIDELAPIGLPLICAGGVGTADEFVSALRLGYDGVQIGTRFIATTECTASQTYKDAIVRATEDDIVLSERVTGVPLAVINTDYVKRVGTKAGPLARRMLRGRRTKHWMRMFYAVRSAMLLRRASLDPSTPQDYWQAGKSVRGIDSVRSVADIMTEFATAARSA